MTTRNRTWLAFGDLRIGTPFRFNYNATYNAVGGSVRLSEDTFVKVSPRKFRKTTGTTTITYTTSAATAVIVVAG